MTDPFRRLPSDAIPFYHNGRHRRAVSMDSAQGHFLSLGDVEGFQRIH